jgi:purine-binding chemotaxis protein CheW
VSDYVTLAVGDERYALPVQSVLEIAEAAPVAPVPRGGQALIGVRNLRGEVLPVFNLATVLGRVADGPCLRHVVVEQGGRRAGLAVGRVVDVGPLVGVFEESESALLEGAVLGEGRLVGVLDVSRLVDMLEVRS